MNLVLTLCDAGDSVVMFAPYYFNAYMSFQMTGVTDILAGIVTPTHFILMFFTLAVGLHAPLPGRAVNLVNLVFNLVTGSSKARLK